MACFVMHSSIFWKTKYRLPRNDVVIPNAAAIKSVKANKAKVVKTKDKKSEFELVLKKGRKAVVTVEF